MFSPSLFSIIEKHENFLGKTDVCHGCGKEFLAHEDGCPNCGRGARVSKINPPMDLSECKKGSYVIVWDRKNGVRILDNSQNAES